ncbi:MAG: hypothetical protein DMF89_24125 [Acidobacteria bacterium]|nr:MAG: hypothetical protein DMF89_24125 [Acidobacteriota bacterium]
MRSDIGAISSGRWHLTHDLYRIGATSFVNVTGADVAGGCWATATVEAMANATTMPERPTATGVKKGWFGKTILIAYFSSFAEHADCPGKESTRYVLKVSQTPANCQAENGRSFLTGRGSRG